MQYDTSKSHRIALALAGPLALSLLLTAGLHQAAATTLPGRRQIAKKPNVISPKPRFSVSQRAVAVWVLAGNNGSNGQYRADLFRVGAPWPTATTLFYMTGTPPSRQITFTGIATNQNYFFRITAPDGETRQPPSFWLPSWPWWTQNQPTIQF